ncbi:MAG: alkyl sulfatase dimerization domain-containing protein [Pseudomonadota bacterium]
MIAPLFFSLLASALLAGCGGPSAPAVPLDADADADGHTPATATTVAVNAAVAEALPLDDQADFEKARRGLVAQMQPLVARRDDGIAVWNMDDYGFVAGDAPPTVNPSLWRQEKLNGIHGLFKVSDGIHQLRGFDLANMTLIDGASGWIVVDPLTVKETAAAALQFARQHLGDRPVSAIIFTHSHVDHFGGVAGVVDAGTAPRIIAPMGFTEEASSENVMAGFAMQRRAEYMYGRHLQRGVRGHVGTGLGKEPPFAGAYGILPPTDVVEHTGTQMVIDGVPFEFQMVSGSEAPAEFTFYLPDHRAFCGAEMVSRNLHNVYTLRGAKVRDALLWSNYIDEAVRLYGERSDVYFGSHHWPEWGSENVVTFLSLQRDAYKYLHDQSLRMANLGMTPGEIAEAIEFPEVLQNTFAVRGYYGTPRHNARAVYQGYFGWYDANPAHLNPLPQEQAAARYVEWMGGAEAMLAKAQASFDEGDYRWVAEAVNHLVFAEPGNAQARALLARTYDQLGYQSESGPWRDAYLTGAYELRHGTATEGLNLAGATDLLRSMPVARFFDAMAARLDGPRADGETLSVRIAFSDLGETHLLELYNAVLHHRPVPANADADVALTLTHDIFLRLATGGVGIKDLATSDELDIEGNPLTLGRFFRYFDKPRGDFAIIEP